MVYRLPFHDTSDLLPTQHRVMKVPLPDPSALHRTPYGCHPNSRYSPAQAERNDGTHAPELSCPTAFPHGLSMNNQYFPDNTHRNSP